MRSHRIQALAVLLTGMLAGCGDSARTRKVVEDTKEALEAAKQATQNAGAKVKAGAERTVEAVQDGAKAASQKIEAGAEKAADAIHEGAEKVEAGAKEALEHGKEKVKEVKDSMTRPDASKPEAKAP